MLDNAKNRVRLDRFAIGLSTLCAVHCVLTILLLGGLTSLGYIFTAPIVHQIGLGLAILVGGIALMAGLKRHRSRVPLIVGVTGLVIMAAALFLPHGAGEAVVTVLGVSLVGMAHLFNIRADMQTGCVCC